MSRHLLSNVLVCVLVLLYLAGCATTTSSLNADTAGKARRPACSIAIQQPDIIVAVSPVRQTFQIGGTIPTLLGAGISAVQDSHYRERILQTLGGYDCSKVFDTRLREALGPHVGGKMERGEPFNTAAGFANERAAQDARLEGLGRSGIDLVFDFDLSYGIYGPEGLLATRLDGKVMEVASGKVLWRNTVTTYSLELYADLRWRDPMKRMTPNLMSPRLSKAEDAINQWTADGGDYLKQCFEQSVNSTVAAALTDMGLEDSPEGHYVLGVQAFLDGDYETAEAHLARANALAPNAPETLNALALTKARDGRLDEAVQIATPVAAAQQDYLPVQYNLAWWLAVDQKNPDAARPYYDRAIALGATPGRRLEKAMR